MHSYRISQNEKQFKNNNTLQRGKNTTMGTTVRCNARVIKHNFSIKIVLHNIFFTFDYLDFEVTICKESIDFVHVFYISLGEK